MQPPLRRPSRRTALALAAFLGVYNNALNLLRPSTATYVGTNTTVAAALLLTGRRAGLDARAMGTSPRQLRAALPWSVAAVGCVSGALAIVSAHPRWRRLLEDRRADVDPAQFRRWVGLRIPLGTVLLEEVAFRGVLYAALRARWSPTAAAAGSGAVFGLWHVVPVLRMLEANAPDASRRARAVAAGTGAVVSALGGMVLCDLRRRSGGILAPMVAHTAANTLFAGAAWRRRHGHQPATSTEAAR